MLFLKRHEHPGLFQLVDAAGQVVCEGTFARCQDFLRSVAIRHADATLQAMYEQLEPARMPTMH